MRINKVKYDSFYMQGEGIEHRKAQRALFIKLNYICSPNGSTKTNFGECYVYKPKVTTKWCAFPNIENFNAAPHQVNAAIWWMELMVGVF